MSDSDTAAYARFETLLVFVLSSTQLVHVLLFLIEQMYILSCTDKRLQAHSHCCNTH
jgi:hypothetical protein